MSWITRTGAVAAVVGIVGLAILRGFLDDDSRIVRTFAMQALADLAEHDEQMRRWVLPLLAELTRTGTPAMRSRGRKLLARLEQPDPGRRMTSSRPTASSACWYASSAWTASIRRSRPRRGS